MPFDPDAFLAQGDGAAGGTATLAPPATTSGGFNPDAYLATAETPRTPDEIRALSLQRMSQHRLQQAQGEQRQIDTEANVSRKLGMVADPVTAYLGTKALTAGGEVGDVAAQTLPGLAGAAALSETGPIGMRVGGALGNLAGDALAQTRRILRGDQEKVSVGSLVASGALGAVMPGPGKALASPVLNAGKNALVSAAQGAGYGVGGAAITNLIDNGKVTLDELKDAASWGSIFGTGFHAAHIGAPASARWMAGTLQKIAGKTPAEASVILGKEAANAPTAEQRDAALHAQDVVISSAIPPPLPRENVAAQAATEAVPAALATPAPEQPAGAPPAIGSPEMPLDETPQALAEVAPKAEVVPEPAAPAALSALKARPAPVEETPAPLEALQNSPPKLSAETEQAVKQWVDALKKRDAAKAAGGDTTEAQSAVDAAEKKLLPLARQAGKERESHAAKLQSMRNSVDAPAPTALAAPRKAFPQPATGSPLDDLMMTTARATNALPEGSMGNRQGKTALRIGSDAKTPEAELAAIQDMARTATNLANEVRPTNPEAAAQLEVARDAAIEHLRKQQAAKSVEPAAPTALASRKPAETPEAKLARLEAMDAADAAANEARINAPLDPDAVGGANNPIAPSESTTNEYAGADAHETLHRERANNYAAMPIGEAMDKRMKMGAQKPAAPVEPPRALAAGKANAETTGNINAVGRSRPRDVIEFSNGGIRGPSGAKLKNYQWQFKLEDGVDKRGEDVTRRISDWEQAGSNQETGRNVVHQFTVEMPDGTQRLVSLESALSLLGYSDSSAGSGKIKSLASTMQTLARARMKLAQVEPLAEARKQWESKIAKEKARVLAAPLPERTLAIDNSSAWKRYQVSVGGEPVRERRGSLWKEEAENGSWKQKWQADDRAFYADKMALRAAGEEPAPLEIHDQLAAAQRSVKNTEKKLATQAASPPPVAEPPRALAAKPSAETPMQKQWRAIKEKNPDSIVLLRLGDFYEAFYGDAKTLSKDGGVTLTNRQGIPMAGVPAYAVDTYTAKLTKAGHKVAVVDEWRGETSENKYSKNAKDETAKADKSVQDAKDAEDHYFSSLAAKRAAEAHDFAAKQAPDKTIAAAHAAEAERMRKVQATEKAFGDAPPTALSAAKVTETPDGPKIEPLAALSKKVGALPQAKRLKVQREFISTAARDAAKDAPPMSEELKAALEEYGIAQNGSSMQRLKTAKAVYEKLSADIPRVTIEAPDDGTYKILETKESLNDFADKVDKKFGKGLDPKSLSRPMIARAAPGELDNFKVTAENPDPSGQEPEPHEKRAKKNAAKALAASAADRAVSALQAAKIHKPGRMAAGNPLTLAWDAALDTAIVGIKAGQKVSEVIAAAIAKFREHYGNSHPAAEADLKAAIEEHHPIITAALEHDRQLEAPPTALAAKKEASAPPPDRPPPALAQKPSAPKEPTDTGIKNAAVDEQNAAIGLPPAKHGEAHTDDADLADAMGRLQRDPSAGQTLITELANGKIASSEEVMLALAEVNRLRIERAKAETALNEAVANGDDAAANTARVRVAKATADYAAAADAVTNTGTLTAQALRIRQRMMKADYSLAAMERRRIAANDGLPLTSEQSQEVRDLHAKVEATQKAFDDYRAKQEADAAAREAAAAKAEPSAPLAARTRKPVNRVAQFLSAQADAARARIRARAGNLNAGLDPTILGDYAVIGADYIAKGVTKAADFAEKMAGEFGEAIRPHIAAIYDAARKEHSKATLETVTEKIKGGLADGESVGDLRAYVSKLAEHFVGNGITDREKLIDAVHGELTAIDPNISRRETMDLISGYGDYKQLNPDEIKAQLRDLKGQMQQVGKLEDMQRGQAPAKTGVERRIPSDTERALIKQVEAAKKKGGFDVTDPATQLKTALQSIKTRLQNQIADLEMQIGSGKQTVEGKTPTPSDAETVALRAKRDALKAQFDEIFKKSEMTDAERMKMAEKAADRQIAELERQLKDGELFPAGKALATSGMESPELAVKRARIAALKEERQYARDTIQTPEDPATPEEIRVKQLDAQIAKIEKQLAEDAPFTPGRKALPQSPEIARRQAQLDALKEQRQYAKDRLQPKPDPKTPEEIALQAYKTRTAQRIADLQEKLATGDFSKKTRAPLPMDATANKLQAELDAVKAQVDSAEERQRLKNLSPLGKIKENALNAYDAARNIMTTGELSFILRQGKVGVLSHPILAAKAIPNTLRALASNPTEAHAINLEVLNHPDAPVAERAKLHLLRENESLNHQEELLMGKLASKIPIVGRFNRAATIFLNKLRFDIWNNMRKSSGGLNAAEEKQLAMFVNEATGRGTLGGLESAAVPLGRLMFSPRFFASRLQLLAGHSMWGGTANSRKAIAKEYARTLVGLGLYYTVLSMVLGGKDKKPEISDDPRSSDFGKVKIGNTRIDPLAGLAQIVTFGGRTVTGEKTTMAGKVVPISGDKIPYGGDKWSDVAVNFARSKLHPIPGAIINLFNGTDLAGNKADLSSQALNMAAPLTYIDIYQALKEQGLADGVALGLLAILGEGLQTYKAKGDDTTEEGRAIQENQQENAAQRASADKLTAQAAAELAQIKKYRDAGDRAGLAALLANVGKNKALAARVDALNNAENRSPESKAMMSLGVPDFARAEHIYREAMQQPEGGKRSAYVGALQRDGTLSPAVETQMRAMEAIDQLYQLPPAQQSAAWQSLPEKQRVLINAILAHRKGQSAPAKP